MERAMRRATETGKRTLFLSRFKKLYIKNFCLVNFFLLIAEA